MDSNRYSTAPPVGPPDDLALLAAAADRLAAKDLDQLSDVARAERVLVLRRLLDRLDGQWLKELAGVDARGAAGAEQDQQVGSTAAWLRGRLRMGAGAATSAVRTARALFRGPLTPDRGRPDRWGHLGRARQRPGPRHPRPPRPPHRRGRTGPGRGRRPAGPAPAAAGPWPPAQVADPEGADRAAEVRHGRRGLWLTPTFEGMVAIDGLLESEAGQIVLAALEPLARPSRRQRPSQRQPAHRRRPHRTGPPQPGGRPAPHHRWGPAPAERGRGPGQPPRPPWAPGWRAGRGRPHRPRGLPAAGLRQRGQPRHRQPPHLRRRPRSDRQPCGAAAGGHGQVASGPGWGPQPAAGRRAQQPSHPTRPASGPGCTGRRLCLPRLHPPPGLVRRPSPLALAGRRPYRPPEPRPALPSPPPGGP